MMIVPRVHAYSVRPDILRIPHTRLLGNTCNARGKKKLITFNAYLQYYYYYYYADDARRWRWRRRRRLSCFEDSVGGARGSGGIARSSVGRRNRKGRRRNPWCSSLLPERSSVRARSRVRLQMHNR